MSFEWWGMYLVALGLVCSISFGIFKICDLLNALLMEVKAMRQELQKGQLDNIERSDTTNRYIWSLYKECDLSNTYLRDIDAELSLARISNMKLDE